MKILNFMYQGVTQKQHNSAMETNDHSKNGASTRIHNNMENLFAKIFYVLCTLSFAITLFTSCEDGKDENELWSGIFGNVITGITTDQGVVINGLTWATCNLAAKGNFAISPEDYGAYFSWEAAQDACPNGWRLPTHEELQSLIDAGSTWTTKNGVKGRIFGRGNNTIFLPTSGFCPSNIILSKGIEATYWDSGGKDLYFTENGVSNRNINLTGDNTLGRSIRCVKDEIIVPLPKYIYIDEDLGNEIDFAILGLDGSGRFYKVQDKNPNIPQRLSIYYGNKDKVDLVINFDEDGLPKNFLSEDFTIVFGKYEEKIFDAVIITKDGKSQIVENIETNISWDEYRSAISGTTLRASASQAPSFSEVDGLVASIGLVDLVVDGLQCALKVYLTGPLAILPCGLWIIDTGELLGLYKMPDWYKTLGRYGDIYDCATGDYWSCFKMVVNDLVVPVSDFINNNSQANIKSGENMLNSPRITSPSYGTAYYCGDWIDIYVTNYTGANWENDLELQYWCLTGEPNPNNPNEPSRYTNKAYQRIEGTNSRPSFTFSPETPSTWDGRWAKLVAINKKNNTRSEPQYVRITPRDLTEIIGVWKGRYSQGTVTLTINNDLTGVFDFIHNTGRTGSYKVSVSYSNGYNVRGTEWIDRPSGFVFSDLIGGVISNGVLKGSSFELTKQ